MVSMKHLMPFSVLFQKSFKREKGKVDKLEGKYVICENEGATWSRICFRREKYRKFLTFAKLPINLILFLFYCSKRKKI